ncbi:MAG: alpha/beta hydrolase-fold protein [Pseudomonadota bacterium]
MAALIALAGPAPADLSEHSFPSQTLGREMAFSVYVPPDYTLRDASYPVLYLLHGLGDDHRSWGRAGIEAIADGFVAEGGAPLIVVMPDAGVSWYADADEETGPGNLHAAIRDDLVAHVDATWRTRPEPAARAVAGHSMGCLTSAPMGQFRVI